MFNLDPIRILLTIPGIIIGFAFHEFAHAYTADRLGDPTPRSQGRLTLSPMAHLDIIGLILIIIVGFGWAKPVETNPRHYRNPRMDDLKVSLAGPLMNLLIAVLFAVLYKLFLISGFSTAFDVKTALYARLLFRYTIYINVLLFLFNLLPIPPLDGFHIISDLASPRHYKTIFTLHRYGTIILMILIITNITSYIIGIPTSIIYGYIARFFGI